MHIPANIPANRKTVGPHVLILPQREPLKLCGHSFDVVLCEQTKGQIF